MRSHFCQTALIAAVATLLPASAALARFPGTSGHTESGQINLIYTSRIANGPELKAGTYKVELAQNASASEVMFYQDGKLMAKAPAKLVSENKKIGQTEIQYNTAGDQHYITEIDLHGWRQELKFPSHSSAMGS